MTKGRRQGSRAIIPSVGKICIGEREGGNGRPKSLNYFIATGKYASMFDKEYGDKPKKLTVVFLSDEISDSCSERVIWRDNKGKIIGTYDYETCVWFKAEKQAYIPTDYEWAKGVVAANPVITEKRELTLSFMLPKLNGLRGVWRLTTQAEESSIDRLIGAFDDVKDSAGSVIGIPFELSVEMATSQAPAKYARKFPVLTLVSNLSLENIETIRGYVHAGNDLRRFGILTNDKLAQIGAEAARTRIFG
jgi:hypothetical protein